MAIEISQLLITLRASADKFAKDMDAASAKLNRTAQTFTRVGATMTRAVTLPLLGIGAAAIKVSSDAQEINNQFDAVFKDFGPRAERELQTFVDSVGGSITKVKEQAAGLQGTFVPLGFARDEAATLSTQLVKLAGDVGSFKNTDPSDVIDRFTSALVGNHEAVRDFGIIITEASLSAKLLELGFEGGTKKATEQQKAMARLAIIYGSTADAQGDLARTSGDFANQFRALKGEIFELGKSFGDILLPFANAAVKAIRGVIKVFLDLPQPIKEAIVILGTLAAVTGPALLAIGFVLPKLAGGLTLVAGALKTLSVTSLLGFAKSAVAAVAAVHPLTLAIVGLATAGIFLADPLADATAKLLEMANIAKRKEVLIPQKQLDKLGISAGQARTGVKQFTEKLLEMEDQASATSPELENLGDEVKKIFAGLENAKADADKVIGDIRDGFSGITDIPLTFREDAFTALERPLTDAEKATKKYELTLSNLRIEIGDVNDLVKQYQAEGLSAAQITQLLEGRIGKVSAAAKLWGEELGGATQAVVKQNEAVLANQRRAEEWNDAWGNAVGEVVGGFLNGVREMEFSWKGMADNFIQTTKDLGKTLLSLVIGGIFEPILNAATQFGRNLGALVGNVLFGTPGPAGGLFGGVGIGGGLLSKLPGLGGGAAAAAGGSAAAAAAAGGGGAAAAGGAAGGGGGFLGSLGGFFTNPFTIGIGGAAALAFLLFGRKDAFESGAKEVERDFGIAISKGTVDGFVNGLGISKEQFEQFRKGILASPAGFENVLLPAAQEQGRTEELIRSFGAFRVSGAFGQNLQGSGLSFSQLGQDFIVDLSDQARAAVEGNFAGLNAAFQQLFGESGLTQTFGTLDQFLSQTVPASAEAAATSVDNITASAETMSTSIEGVLTRLDEILIRLTTSVDQLLEKLLGLSEQLGVVENAADTIEEVPASTSTVEVAPQSIAVQIDGQTVADATLTQFELTRRERLTRIVRNTGRGL